MIRNATSTISWRRGRRSEIEEQSVPRWTEAPWGDLAIKLLVPVLLMVSLVVAIKFGSLQAYVNLLRAGAYTSWLPGLAAAYTLVLLAFQVMRTVLWARYQPYPRGEGPLPALTVILPAYNEGAMVAKAIDAVAACDYPAEKLEIICIDDGSTDDTWTHILRGKERYPHLVQTIRFAENRGKKEALYAGFTQGRGEIFVTVDSDSVVAKDALRHLVAPLMQDGQMGAVAGNVKVLQPGAEPHGQNAGGAFR